MGHPGTVHIREYAPTDQVLLEQVVDVANALRRADSPWEHPETLTNLRHGLRYGWDGQPNRGFVLLDDDRVLAIGNLWVSTYDNLHFADVWVGVPPEARRRGHGSTMLAWLLEEARRLGRTSAGIGGWDSEATHGFASAHGFAVKARDVNRRQFLSELDWDLVEKLYAEAAEHATDYELLRLADGVPADLLPAVADMVAAINDAPRDDLDLEDEVFPVERVAEYERIQRQVGRLYRVVARHRHTGELAGHTVVHVEAERPEIGAQHDTSVVRAHRGHRLGLLLKADLLRWLREAEPQVASIDTWNAKSNDHMIGVNEALGYRVMGETVYFQRDL